MLAGRSSFSLSSFRQMTEGALVYEYAKRVAQFVPVLSLVFVSAAEVEQRSDLFEILFYPVETRLSGIL